MPIEGERFLQLRFLISASFTTDDNRGKEEIEIFINERRQREAALFCQESSMYI